MRPSIDIDDQLMAEALKVGDFKTRKEAVEEGLRLLVKTRRQGRIKRLCGGLRWEGPLDDMRSTR